MVRLVKKKCYNYYFVEMKPVVALGKFSFTKLIKNYVHRKGHNKKYIPPKNWLIAKKWKKKDNLSLFLVKGSYTNTIYVPMNFGTLFQMSQNEYY